MLDAFHSTQRNAQGTFPNVLGGIKPQFKPMFSQLTKP